MRLVFVAALVFAQMGTAYFAEAEERVISPDRRFAVVTLVSTEDEREVQSYAIRVRATGETLATCPDDGRFGSGPSGVRWSPDSRFVAISTHTQRHGDLPDLWEVTSRKATLLPVDFAMEEYAVYVTPKRWLDRFNLKCEVFGKSSSEHRELHPDETFIAYWLRIRIDPSSHQTKVFRTKPEYSKPEAG